MNEIDIRTNRSEYVGGSVIYGAIYLRVFSPINADCLVISLSGKESSNWKRTLLNLNFTTNESADAQESDSKIIKFEGEKVILLSEYTVETFSDGTVPFGCYAYPFKFTLKQGLPNSFRIIEAKDDIKLSSYEAAVTYKITAKLQCSSSPNQSKLGTSKMLTVRNEEMVLIDRGKCQKMCVATVNNCFCFPKGELTLKLELDKVVYTVGETMVVKFCVENKSDVKLKEAKIKLMRTIIIIGRQSDSENEKLDIQEAFPSEIYNICQEFDLDLFKKKSFEVLLALESNNNGDMLTSTLGSIVKCRYQLEVEVVVPWDEDVSVLVPIQVFPGPLDSWLAWKPAEWIKTSNIVNTSSICKVPKHILESSEFANVPLPFR